MAKHQMLIPASDVFAHTVSTRLRGICGTSTHEVRDEWRSHIGTGTERRSKWRKRRATENFFLFGLTAQRVVDTAPVVQPAVHYENEPETRAALDLIFS
jgi:starch phosphorylase